MRGLSSSLPVVLLLATSCATAQRSSSTGSDTLERIKTAKVIKLGYRESSVPFSFAGSDGKPMGYSVDLCAGVVEGLGHDLAIPDLRIEWVKVTPETRINALLDDTIDLECGSTTNTLSRQERVDFSNLTFVDGTSLLTRSDANFEKIGDLAGKRIAVVPGTTTQQHVRDIFGKAGATPEIVAVKEHALGLAAVDQRRADAYASDRSILLGLALSSPDWRSYSILNSYLSYEPYGLMLRRDAAFRLAVNRQLSRIYRSGAIANIYGRWFALLGTPSDLLLAVYALSALPE
jgi:glutamate/aspartate transport system substrate-binding protein